MSKNINTYLLGGNSQIGCEIYIQNNISLFNSSTTTLIKKNNIWKKLPELNEERQEYSFMYFNDNIYIYICFSHLKWKKLSSIERINIDKNDEFEIVYINGHIALSSLSSAVVHYIIQNMVMDGKMKVYYY